MPLKRPADSLGRPLDSFRLAELRLAPFAEHEPAQSEPESERPDAERPYRQRLAPRGKALPTPKRLALLLGQGLAPALLADGASGAQAEIEIVEDLGAGVRHVSQCTSLPRRYPRTSSNSRTRTSAPAPSL